MLAQGVGHRLSEGKNKIDFSASNFEIVGMIPLAASSGDPGMAFVSIILFVVAAALAIAWLVFPFIVIEKFNTMAKVQRDTNLWLKHIAALLAKEGVRPPDGGIAPEGANVQRPTPNAQCPMEEEKKPPPVPQPDVYRL